MRWRHVTINTKGTWLHGDERGFRSRKHRIHSSGDYKHRPPPREHSGLREYMKHHSGDEVTIPYNLRPTIGRAVVQWFLDNGYRILAIAVGKVHTHSLAELLIDLGVVKQLVGEAKRKSSRAVKNELPGSIWSAGCKPEPVDDQAHQDRSYDYILFEQGADAWTWSFADGTFEGVFNRQRPKNRPKRKNPGRRFALPRRGGGGR